MKTDMEKDLNIKSNEHMLQVTCIKKSQEAAHKKFCKKDKYARDKSVHVNEQLRTRIRKLRLRLLVKRAVERFKENVNRKRTKHLEQFGQSEGEEIKVRIRAKPAVAFDSLKREDTKDSLRSLVTINKPVFHMARPYSRSASRSSFEDAITAEYLNSNNMIYRQATPDGDLMSVQVTGKGLLNDNNDVQKVEIKYINTESDLEDEVEDDNQSEKSKDMKKYLSQLKRTLVVTLPDITSDSSSKMKVKYDTSQKAFIGLSMKYPEMYHPGEYGDLKQSLELQDVQLLPETKSTDVNKQQGQNSKSDWQSDLPSVNIQRAKTMLLSDDFMNHTACVKSNGEKARPNSREDEYINSTQNHSAHDIEINNEKLRLKKNRSKMPSNDGSNKYSCSIPLIRSDDSIANRLSVVGTNPNSADGKRDIVKEAKEFKNGQTNNKNYSSKQRKNRMSVTLLNRKRAQANQDRYFRLSDGVLNQIASKEKTNDDPLKTLEHKARMQFMFTNQRDRQVQRKLVKSEYSVRSINKDGAIGNLPKPVEPNIVNNASDDSGINDQKRKFDRQRLFTPNAKSTETVTRKPDNMSEFVFRVFFRQNSFTKLPSYMDPKSEENLKHCHYLKHFTHHTSRDKVMARLSKMSGWRANSFTCGDEFRTRGKLASNNSAYL